MGKAWDTLASRDLELGPLSAAGAKPELAWRHWKLARDSDALAWLVLDKAGASANTLSKEVLTELDDALTIIERELPHGVVLRSAKPGGFMAGADIGEFRAMTDAGGAAAPLAQAHTLV